MLCTAQQSVETKTCVQYCVNARARAGSFKSLSEARILVAVVVHASVRPGRKREVLQWFCQTASLTMY